MKYGHSGTLKDRQFRYPLLIDTAFSNIPASFHDELLSLRELIFETHEEEPKAGQLHEVLRWGQLSYVTSKPKTGSLLRVGLSKCERPTLFCHCGTTLVEYYRQEFPDTFDFDGNRALIMTQPVEACRSELRHCIRQALTYNLK